MTVAARPSLQRSTMAPPRTSHNLPLPPGGREEGEVGMTAMKKKNIHRAAAALLLSAAALLFRGEDFPPRHLSSSSTGDGLAQRELDDGLGGDPMPERALYSTADEPCDRNLQSVDGRGEPCSPKTPYVHLDQAKSSMPRIDRSVDKTSPPTSVKLCRELLQRDELLRLSANAAATGQNIATPKMELYEAEEHHEVCVDWNHPHSSLMEMFASSVIAAAGSAGHGLHYSHNCGRTNEHTLHGGMGFDATTIQQALPESGLIVHPHTVEADIVKELCRGCMQEWQDGPGRLEEGWWGRSHQCILFPQPGDRTGDDGGFQRAQARMDDSGAPEETQQRGGGGNSNNNKDNPTEIPPSSDEGDYDDYGVRKLGQKAKKAIHQKLGLGVLHAAGNRRTLQAVPKNMWSSGGEGERTERRPEPEARTEANQGSSEKLWSSGGEGEVGERPPEPEARSEPEGPQEPDSDSGDEMQFAARTGDGGAPQQVSAQGGSAQVLGSGGSSQQAAYGEVSPESAIGGATALRAVLPTIRDRLRFAALDYYPKSSPHPEESKSGAVIYLDGTTTAVPFYVYTSHIPPFVTSVHILAGSECARAHLENGEACVDHGRKLRHYLSVFYPQAHVRFDLVASSAAAYSRMVMAKMLMCPPGTVSCLLPALAKPEGTNAVVVEALNRENTYHWFTTLQETQAGNAQHVDAIDLDHIQVVTVDVADTAGGGMTTVGGGDGDSDFESTLLKDPPLRSEGCDQIRGKMGEWIPEDVNSNPALKGLVDGIMMRGANRYQEKRAEMEKTRERGSGKVTFGGGEGEAGKAFKWVETAFPTCQMDKLTLPGLCAAVETLGISRIFFLGDVLQGQMVLSLWTLLGLSDYPGHKTMGAWNRVVDCPEPFNAGQSFEIAYARNDDLDDNQRIDVSPSHANYPWIKDYLSGGEDPNKRTLLVASTGAYVQDYDRFRRSLDKFAHHTLDALKRPDDLVFYRTSAPGHRDCEEVNGARSGVLTEEAFVRYNNAAMEEFHNRELDKRGGPEFVQASWSATGLSQGPSGQGGEGQAQGGQQPEPTTTAKHGVQVLDVYHMTVRHPEGAPALPTEGGRAPDDSSAPQEKAQEGATPGNEYKPKEVHDCAHEYRPGPPDAWNHMLYTKLVDLAQEFKEHQRRHHIW